MMDELKKKAKMEVIAELLGLSENMMGDDLSGHMDSAKKVTVAAPDEESLAEGLDVAKDAIEGEDDIMKEATSEMMSDMEPSLEMDEDSDEEEDDEDMKMFGRKGPKQRQRSKFNMFGED